MVARLQSIEYVAGHMALYLEGSTLALYLEMNKRNQLDAEMIE